jgi:hypothetical protein
VGRAWADSVQGDKVSSLFIIFLFLFSLYIYPISNGLQIKFKFYT